MKHFYAFLIALLVMSCNNFKTDNTLQLLTQKAESLNALKKADLKHDIATLEYAASLDDTFKNKYSLILNVTTIADTYFNYLDSIKSHVKNFKPNSGKEKVINSLQKEYFSNKDITKQGLQFLDSLEAFKRKVALALNNDFPKTKSLLDSLFNIKPVKILNNKEENWLAFQFKSVSNVESLANLTLLQSNIVAVEKHLMSTIMGDEQVDANAYRVDVVLEKSKYYPGDKVKGKLFISKASENLVPTNVIVNGNKIDEHNYADGEVAISFRASNELGEHPLEGELNIRQGTHDLLLYFNKIYAVVSRPKAKAQSKNPKNTSANKFDDTKKAISSTNIGKLPVPHVSIRGKEANSRGVIKLTKASLRMATIDVVFPNSDYEAVVTEFSFKPSNQPTLKIYGNKLTTRAISILNKSKRGRIFKIFNVKSKLKIKAGYRVKTPETVNIELID
jgi:GldM second domain/GldM N-terminal domain/GldM C-terminal domain